MIIDTSAIIAILQQEQEAQHFSETIAEAKQRMLSAGNFLEASILIQARKGAEGVRDLDLLIARLKIEIVPFTADHARLARMAYNLFGKGRHPAGLNFGDCISYALARHTGFPLLYKGEDFSQTDIA